MKTITLIHPLIWLSFLVGLTLYLNTDTIIDKRLWGALCLVAACALQALNTGVTHHEKK
ncbi:MAG: hypothetical protein U0V54_09405 [Saprospiraceae bacterium]|nr:hypothetical protein [Saprospiraceae bacterium]